MDRAYEGILFDMDGTLLTSIGSSERVWSRWASGHGLDASAFLPSAHGMRVVEVIANLGLPGLDAGAEAALITEWEMADLDGVRAVRGAAAFLRALPPDRWAVVTSAPRALARRRLEAAALPMPAVLVSGEDVVRGKPDPACFELAASRLGLTSKSCLVFEDADAGVRAARAAGADVLVVTSAHAGVWDGGGDGVVGDFYDLAVRIDPGGAVRVRREP